jgi:hypothetical protein
MAGPGSFVQTKIPPTNTDGNLIVKPFTNNNAGPPQNGGAVSTPFGVPVDLSTIPVGANPTALVGLTVVNGTASTFMRSDAAPPLDQTIAPTWTGLHTFNQSLAASTAGNAVVISNPVASIAGNPQYSPAIEWDGSSFVSGASELLSARAFVRTVDGTDVASWVVQGKAGPGSWNDLFSATFDGNLVITEIVAPPPSGNYVIIDDGSGQMIWGSDSNMLFEPSTGHYCFMGVLAVGNPGTPGTNSIINLYPLPASITGLNTGDVWNNGNVLCLASATINPSIAAISNLTANGLVKTSGGTGLLSVGVAGTDYAPPTSGGAILYGNGSGGFSNVAIGSGVAFTGGTLSATGSGGTVTSISVVTANGFAGTVATPTSTPAITIKTTVTGILQGNGTALSAITVGTGLSFTGGTLACTVTAPSGANPSASVGLAAVNGSAGTFMRSDGAPALSQAIAPTWTGIHTWSNTTQSTSVSTGSIHTAGGLGVSKDMWIGGGINLPDGGFVGQQGYPTSTLTFGSNGNGPGPALVCNSDSSLQLYGGDGSVITVDGTYSLIFTDSNGTGFTTDQPGGVGFLIYGANGGNLTLQADGNVQIAPFTNLIIQALSTNGFVKTTGGTGLLAVDTNTYSQVQSGRATAQTAANANVQQITVGAADADYLISSNVNVTAVTVASFSVTCTYHDETNTSRVLTLNFSNLAATFIQTITQATGTGAYEGVPVQIRAKAGTTITIATTGTFTSVTYNITGSIRG